MVFKNPLVLIKNAIFRLFGSLFALIANSFELLARILSRPRWDRSLKLISPEDGAVEVSDSDTTKCIDNGEIGHLRQLSAALNAMRLSDIFTTDVTLLCETKEFKAHQQVLTSASPFFDSALTKGWKETTLGCIELPTVSSGSMDAILSFIYTRDLKVIPLDKPSLKSLVKDADFLQLDDLVKCSYQTLAAQHLTTSEFYEIYDFLEGINNKYCLSEIENLLAERFSAISLSKDFFLLKPRQLNRILQSSNMYQHCLQDIVSSLLRWAEFEDKREESLKDFLNIFLKNMCQECLKRIVYQNVSMPWKKEIIEGLWNFLASDCETLKRNSPNLLLWFGAYGHNGKHVLGMHDLKTCTWLIKDRPLPFKLNCARAMVTSGCHVYFIGGGRHELAPSTRVKQYCPFTNDIIKMSEGSLILPVWVAGAGMLQKFIYVVNGIDINLNCLRAVQRYDTVDDSCHLVASTNYPHYGPRVLPFNDDRLFVLGDHDPEERFVEQYNSHENQWTVVTIVPGFSDLSTASIYETKLFVLKGDSFTKFNVYDISRDEWSVRNFHNTIAIILQPFLLNRKGKAMIFGIDYDSVFHSYDVSSSKWEALPIEIKNVKLHHVTCI